MPDNPLSKMTDEELDRECIIAATEVQVATRALDIAEARHSRATAEWERRAALRDEA